MARLKLQKHCAVSRMRAEQRQCKVLDLLLLRDSGSSAHSYMGSGWVPREGGVD